jgi:RNA polymerase sigma-70 factor (ECF subfamily)
VLTAEQLAAERRLIEASKQQAPNFARLYERYFDRVYAYALTRTGERAAAEDVTAETFRVAFQNLSRFEWRGVPFSAWLFRIAANAAADLHKRTAREAALVTDADHAAESWDIRFIEAEERARLFELVKRLPGAQRSVIVMRFGEEKSIKQIAQAISRSEGAVKKLQSRALRTLRGWLEESND